MSDLTTTSADGRAISRAINQGWILRGFLLGIGFWLSGLVALAIGLGLMALVGGSLASLGGH